MAVPITPWVLSYPGTPTDAPIKLFCFPHAGGGASSYRPWAQRLSSIQVNPVQLPGRETRFGEGLIARMPDLIGAAVPELLRQIDRPFALFGHSMGALLAFEVCRELRRRQAPLPRALLVSGYAGPQLPRTGSKLHALPEDQLIEELRRITGDEQTSLSNPDLRALYVPVLRADFALLDHHVHEDEPPLPVPIVAFGGTSDPGVTRQHLEAWREVTSEPFDLHLLPGGHFYLHPPSSDLLQRVETALDVVVR